MKCSDLITINSNYSNNNSNSNNNNNNNNNITCNSNKDSVQITHIFHMRLTTDTELNQI